MKNLTTKDWDVILAALWFAKYKSGYFGESERFLKTYKKVEKYLSKERESQRNPEEVLRANNPNGW